jgi:hypothetical protein
MTRKKTGTGINPALPSIFRKYPDCSTPPSKLDPLDQWSQNDIKALARLVGKYTKAGVFAAAGIVTIPQRGRQPQGNIPDFEKIDFVEWFDERVSELKNDPNPPRAARVEAFHFEFGQDVPAPTDEQLKHIKKRYELGRKLSK